MKGIYILSLIIPIVLSIVGFFWATIPTYKSTHFITGINHSIEIIWDPSGIPTIDAQDQEDAFYAIGYITAQERLWQIDIVRRIATGRLSELLGEQALELDKFFRTLGINKLAKRDLEYQKPETVRLMKKYVQGINSYIESGNKLPPDYFFTWSLWEQWTIEDSYAIKYFMGYFLDNHWGLLTVQNSLMQILGEEATNKIFPQGNKNYPYIKYTVEQNEIPENIKGGEKQEYIRSEKLIFGETHLSTDIGASNAWVISGKHTQSGKPIVAGDPHLTASIPGPLFLVNVKIQGQELFSAALLPGSLGFCSFTNKYFTYTTTAQISLGIDLYMMQRNSSKPSQFLYNGVYEEAEIQYEQINIKGGSTYNLLIENTRNGPIINIDPKITRVLSPYLTSLSFNAPIALKWVNYAIHDNSDDAILCIMKAQTVYDLRKCTYYVKQVRLSFIAADNQGNIIFQTAGAIPKRKAIPQGILEGWNPQHSWSELIPADEMPYSINPEKGYLVTANNPIIRPDFKHSNSFPAISFVDRAYRISQLIEENIKSGIKMTVKDVLKIQSDVGSIRASKILPTLIELLEDHPFSQQLQNWNQQMDKSSNTAFVYAAWFRNIQRNLIEDEVPEELMPALLRSFPYRTFIAGLFNSTTTQIDQGTDNFNSNRWCDDKRTKWKETCRQLVRKSLDQAIEEVGQQTWGVAHAYNFNHLPFGNVPILSWLYNRKYEARGSDETVSAALWDTASDSYQTVHGSMFRIIREMEGQCIWNNLPGQSGNVFSKYYDNLIKSFTNDHLMPCNVDPPAGSTLQRLSPDKLK